MHRLLAIFAVITIACAGCVSTNSTRIVANQGSDYVPPFKRRPEGFRPTIPYFLPEVSFLDCEYLSPAGFANIHSHFTRPLCEGRYCCHIGAIVINGSYESISTSFTIWLIDGRRLESGFIFFNRDGSARRDFNEAELGRQFYVRALQLLQRAIPESKIKEAKNAKAA